MSGALIVPSVKEDRLAVGGRVFNTNLRNTGKEDPVELVRVLAGELTWKENLCRVRDGSCNGAVSYVESDDAGNLRAVYPAGLPPRLLAEAEGKIRAAERKTRITARLRRKLATKAPSP